MLIPSFPASLSYNIQITSPYQLFVYKPLAFDQHSKELKSEVEALISSKGNVNQRYSDILQSYLFILKNDECKISINKLKSVLLDKLDKAFFYGYMDAQWPDYNTIECDDVDQLLYLFSVSLVPGQETVVTRNMFGDYILNVTRVEVLDKCYKINIPSKTINILNLDYSYQEIKQYLASKIITRDTESQTDDRSMLFTEFADQETQTNAQPYLGYSSNFISNSITRKFAAYILDNPFIIDANNQDEQAPGEITATMIENEEVNFLQTENSLTHLDVQQDIEAVKFGGDIQLDYFS